MDIKYSELNEQEKDFNTFEEYNQAVKEEVGDNDLLMSHDEFVSGGKGIEGVPTAVTPDGEAPMEMEEITDIGELL